MKKGFTLVELLAVITVLSLIIVLVTPKALEVIEGSKQKMYDNQINMIKNAAKQYATKNSYDLIWINDTAIVSINDLINSGLIKTPVKNPKTGNNFDYANEGVVITKNTNKYNYLFQTEIIDLYPSEPNPPLLATGMIPVYWDPTYNSNAGTWRKADSTNTSSNKWYNYNAKQWANAVTVSSTNRAAYLAGAYDTTIIPESDILTYMVWIPRYGYRIATGYHSSTTGTINVKFLQGTTNTFGYDIIFSNLPVYIGSSQTNYIKHPAFTFGTDELTGIWVSKFEASGTTMAVDSKPNAAALTSLYVTEMFAAGRNMETNVRYGWGTTGTGIDTHMIKNIEWGAVAYLSKSIYGQNINEIWMNPSDTFETGCAGDSSYSFPTTGCLNTYNSINGVKASTTGNIYGIYDMNGGAEEYTSAYVNNGSAGLTGNLNNSIIIANTKYKDVYPVTTDSAVNNYNNAINMKGDAVYETSSSYTGSSTWFSNYSGIPKLPTSWFTRGGSSGTGPAGIFNFSNRLGNAYGDIGFRFVLAVSAGL